MTSDSNVVTLIERLKKDRCRLNLVPIESSVSLPVPFKSKGKVFLIFFFFTGGRIESKNRIQVFRPHAKIVVDYPRGKIVYYIDMVSFDETGREKWKNPIGEFPHKEIETLSLREYNEKRRELLTQYDTAIDQFVGGTFVSDFKNEFRERFYQLCEPCLLDFLRGGGKSFFEWLDK